MRTKEKVIRESEIKYYFIGLITLIAITAITLININETGLYPWGENIYRYIQSKNATREFNCIVAFNIICGGFGFLLWGKYFKRKSLCFLFAMIWFFIPTNLRVLFSEGNLPIAMINALMPYLTLVYYKIIKDGKKINYILISVIIAIMTILNSTITIMLLVLLYFTYLFQALMKKVDKSGFFILGILTVIVVILRFTVIEHIQNWIFPKGIQYLVFPLEQTFNPLLRFDNIQVFYIGLSFLLVSLLGIIFGSNKNKEKLFFGMALVLFIGTSSFFTMFYTKLPISEFLVLSRIASLGVIFIFLGLVKWMDLNKLVLIIIAFSISMDSFLTFDLLGFNRDLPKDLINKLDIASDITSNKIALLDISTFGSFPSYYLKEFKDIDEDDQLFNNNWMKKANSKKLIEINTSLENGYFLTMFDRTLESGADTVFIKKIKELDEGALEKAAKKVGYKEVYQDDEVYIFKYPIEEKFQVKTTYDGLAIGEYSSNIIGNFPNFTVGNSIYLDDYTIDELKSYKSIFLSGFKYRDKDNAEKIIHELSKDGVRVLVDIINFQEDEFLGVIPQSIELDNDFGQVYYKGQEINLSGFITEDKKFKCNYIGNIPVTGDTYAIKDTAILNYTNYINDNLILVGLNLSYYLYETKDKEALKVMEDLLEIKGNTLPTREIMVGE